MTIDLIELKTLAEAAMYGRYIAPVALHDYRMTMTPEVTLELITEIERHRLTNTEGCKPESSIPPLCMPRTGTATSRSLDNAEGGTPDSNIPTHPDDMLAIIRQRREFMKSTGADLVAAMDPLQDQAYALGLSRGRAEHALSVFRTRLSKVLPTVADEDDMLAIIRQRREFMRLTGADRVVAMASLQDQTYALGLSRGRAEHALAALDNGSEAVSYDE